MIFRLSPQTHPCTFVAQAVTLIISLSAQTNTSRQAEKGSSATCARVFLISRTGNSPKTLIRLSRRARTQTELQRTPTCTSVCGNSPPNENVRDRHCEHICCQTIKIPLCSARVCRHQSGNRSWSLGADSIDRSCRPVFTAIAAGLAEEREQNRRKI